MFENSFDEGKALVISLRLRYAWVAPGVRPEMVSPLWRQFPMTDFDVEGLVNRLKEGEIIVLHTQELKGRVKDIIHLEGIKSFIIIPITVENSWWGILTLNENRYERQWNETEKYSIRAAADMLGAAVERQQIEAALLKAKETAEEASRAKTQFLANMSHEIRTPITGVIGMLQLMQRTEMDKRQGRYAANALSSAETLLAVIGDVLDFSKIEAGKMGLEEEAFRVTEVVESTVRLFAERADDKGLELVCETSDYPSEMVFGDKNRLRQILVNLIGNAMKYTEEGKVFVRCRQQDSSDEATTIHVEVQDTGCGIEPGQQALIFDAFAQVDTSMARPHSGTGLGLAISRELCHLMGGDIGLTSEPGKGSTFRFNIPFKKSQAEPPRTSRYHLDLRGLRVLVVDDCDTTRRIIREIVSSWIGWAEDAPDAAVGLEKLRTAAKDGRPFSVALLDWRMPVMDGLSMARIIKEDAELKQTGLVLLSSFTQIAESKELVAAGIAVSVSKPVCRSELYDAIVTAANGGSKTMRIPSPKPAAKPLLLGSTNSGSILVAEDNDINREVAFELIAELGYRCESVSTGRQAVEAVKHGKFDLVFMDCQMPEMDGYEATRTIRCWEERDAAPHDGRRIPVVALTAHAGKDDRDHCLEAGMDDYLTKPLDPYQLSNTLRKWVKPGDSLFREESEPVTPGEERRVAIDYPSLLQRCMGRRELAERLAKKFIEQAGNDLSELMSAAEGNDAEAIAATAHRLKGAAANLSAELIRETALQLETMGRERRTVDAHSLILELRDQLEAFEAGFYEADRQFP